MASGFKSNSLPHLKYYNQGIYLPVLNIYGESDGIIPKGKMHDYYLHTVLNI